MRGEKTEGEREKEFRRERDRTAGYLEKSLGRPGIEGKNTKPGWRYNLVKEREEKRERGRKKTTLRHEGRKMEWGGLEAPRNT